MPVFTEEQSEQIFVVFDEALDRAKQFIEFNLWAGIQRSTLEAWAHQLTRPEEKLVGTVILRNLCYRSKAQTTALAKQIFQRRLPDLLAGSRYERFHTQWLDVLSNPSAPRTVKIRLVPVIKRKDRPTKSGPVVARLLKVKLGIDEKFMSWPHEVAEQVRRGQAEVIIFIDDIAATGNQFSTFLRDFNLGKDKNVIWGYTPFSATKKAMQTIALSHPLVKVRAAEVLDDSAPLFSSSPFDWIGVEEIKHAYNETVERLLKCKPNLFYGYGELALTYAFEHATPNNNVPLLWKRGDNFIPLLER